MLSIEVQVSLVFYCAALEAISILLSWMNIKRWSMRYHKPAKRMMKTTSSVVVVCACRVSPSSTMRVILLAKYVYTFKGFDFASSLLSVSKVELLLWIVIKNTIVWVCSECWHKYWWMINGYVWHVYLQYIQHAGFIYWYGHVKAQCVYYMMCE